MPIWTFLWIFAHHKFQLLLNYYLVRRTLRQGFLVSRRTRTQMGENNHNEKLPRSHIQRKIDVSHSHGDTSRDKFTAVCNVRRTGEVWGQTTRASLPWSWIDGESVWTLERDESGQQANRSLAQDVWIRQRGGVGVTLSRFNGWNYYSIFTL